MLQDIFPHELNNSFKNKKPEENDYIVAFHKKCVDVRKDNDCDYNFPVYSEIKNTIKTEELIYLFSVNDRAYYLSQEKINFEGQIILSLSDVRKMKYKSFKEMYFIICTAWHLHLWYTENKYCGKCRRKLVHGTDERVLICEGCESRVYPRISPAVIVGVTDGERIILSKYAGREYKGYALISGFVEIGETLEQTVAREVMEEAGVKVKNIRYYKSQPGGIDGNILAGFFCELDGSDAITIDRNELEFAGWFNRCDIPLEDDGFSLTREMIGKFKKGDVHL